MQFTEAIKIIRDFPASDLPRLHVRLMTGFTPLHLQTFLQAHLQQRIPGKCVMVQTDVYGDLTGALTRIDPAQASHGAIALEWTDLDPRLGFRQLGGWGPKELADIGENVHAKLSALKESLLNLPDHFPLALSLPTVDLAPIFHTPSWQLCEAEIRLRHAIDEFALWATSTPNIKLVRLNATLPPFDLKGELMAGLPYTLAHADRLAEAFAKLLAPPLPKKGLITDLDDTLWAGIAGEIGPDAVSWDLDRKTQHHGLYQQLLRALSDQGVLIGVASKNDPEIVEAVFRRRDLAIPRDRIFPLEAYWNEKSESVTRILKTWNIHADSVVFVDDSSSELAEVKSVHPGVECIRFDGQDYNAVHNLLRQLRDLFAKQAITTEDSLRRESLRSAAVFRQAPPGTSHENFLQAAEAQITFDFAAAKNPRSLELVDKTNQFNLNGTHYSEPEWRAILNAPNAFAISASYRDKYGPLGVIAVMTGIANDELLSVNTWVMSCRAFGRRIEHQCLKAILAHFSASELLFQFSPTPRNEYFQRFSESLLGEKPSAPFKISRALFLDRCPKLYHEVEFHHE